MQVDRDDTYSPTLKIGNRKGPNFSKWIFGLSIIGLFTSAYLIKNHYDEEKSACDFGSGISCSVVNKSEYSMLFNVPVAVLGFCWFIVLTFFSLIMWEANTSSSNRWEHWCAGLLLWTSSGIGFVFYLVGAEIILGAICPFCTIIHIICIIVFVMAWKMAPTPFPNPITTVWILRFWVLLAIGIHLVPLVYFNRPEPSLDSFVKCVRDQGIKMYGHSSCSVCSAQSRLFGSSWQFIEYIDCAKNGDLCTSHSIHEYPTWIKIKNGKEVTRHRGPFTTNELSAFSGCKKHTT